MQLLVIASLFIVIGVGIYTRTGKVQGMKIETVEITNQTSTSTPNTPTTTVANLEPSRSLPDPTPTLYASSPTVTPIFVQPTKSAENVNFWTYPNSKQVAENIFESGDDVDKITEWYKNQIRDLGYSTRSFVSTTTNGVVLNKLMAARNSTTISIQISQGAESSKVKIEINAN